MGDDLSREKVEGLREWATENDYDRLARACEVVIEVEQSDDEAELSAATARNMTVQPPEPTVDGAGSTVIHGIALGPGDITKGKNGRKKWPADTLKEAAASLEGRPLVRDHINSTLGNVGEVTKSQYKDGVGVLFEAELDDEELAAKVENGRLDVSARLRHPTTEDLPTEDGAAVIPTAEFVNLSLVNAGAAPSNTVEVGTAAELSTTALSTNLNDGDAEKTQAKLEWYERRGWDDVADRLRDKVDDKQ